MKILYLTNLPSPYRVDFFEELGKLCKLTVLYERKKADNRDGKWLSSRGKNYKEVFLSGINVGNEAALSLDVIKWLKKEYDLIIIGGYSTPTGMIAMEYLRIKKIPFILNSDGGFIKKDSQLRYRIKKYFISKATFWLSTGKYTNDYLKYYGAMDENIYTYPFTSLKQKQIMRQPIKVIEKFKVREKLDIKEEKIIVSVGQFIHRKGFDVLLKATAGLPNDVGVYIIGGEPTEKYLELKKKLDLTNVHFIGFQKQQKISDYYLAADLFVLPTREDIWGLVINESMAHGLPVITTNKCVAGLELVKEGVNGFIIACNDENTLNQKIKEVLYDRDLSNKMGRESLNKIKTYTIENMAEKHIEIFEKVIERINTT